MVGGCGGTFVVGVGGGDDEVFIGLHCVVGVIYVVGGGHEDGSAGLGIVVGDVD